MKRYLLKTISIIILTVFSVTGLPLSGLYAEEYYYKDPCWNNSSKDYPYGGDDGKDNGAGSDCSDRDADPVNVFNGNFEYNTRDLFIPSRGMALEITRYYNAKDVYEGPFGYGWSHTYNIALLEVNDGIQAYVTIRNDHGSIDSFIHVSGTDFTAETKECFDELKKYDTFPEDILALNPGFNSGYCLKKKHGERYLFDINGKLKVIADRNNNKITLTYDGQGR
ncbi:MAG: hypothetical protein HY810_10715, partial [Candidatus Omnitrophica bacterium]|nr:hypothetical protein [Candidatus Omnitrophota bacterium]